VRPGAALVLRANATDLPLEDSSVDLVVTSPPYFALRSYRDGDEHYDGQIGSEPTPAEFLEALWASTREMVRVLKPSGSIFVNLGDKYAGSGGHNNSGISAALTLRGNGHVGGGPKLKATRRSAPDRYVQESGGARPKSLLGLPWRYALGCIDDLGLILRAEIVWSKPNGLPESVRDRVRRSHEQWFHLVKEPRYFAGVDEVREPHVVPFHAPGNKSFAKERNDGDRLTEVWGNPLGKLPGSVWTIPTEPLAIPEWAKEKLDLPDHFAAFPTEWPRRFVLGWSPSGICLECGEGRVPVVGRGGLDLSRQQARRALELAREGGLTEEHFAAIRALGGGADGNSPSVTAAKGVHGLALEAKEVLGSYWREFGSGERTEIIGYSCSCYVGPDDPLPDTRPAVVLDPFGGTGTTALVATSLGRDAISVDLSGDYSRLARWRIHESGHGRKAIGRTWKERQGAMEGLA
jgi:DNA modification methylase